MTLTLDPQLEQRIQREIDLGHYGDPTEVIAHALSLLEAEQKLQEEERNELDARLQRSITSARRGELFTPEQARQILADRRASRSQ